MQLYRLFIICQDLGFDHRLNVFDDKQNKGIQNAENKILNRKIEDKI